MRNKLPYDKTIDFLGAKLNYQVFGKGKPLIFIHGLVANSSPYIKGIKLIAQYYTVYNLDLPGYGGSDVIPGRLHNTDLFAEAVTTFLKKLELEQVPIIAFSTSSVAVAKAALKGIAKGKLIFVSVPGKVSGLQFEITNRLPLFFKRFLISTSWGKKNLLLPILRENTGKNHEKNTDEEFLQDIASTDPKAIVDIDVKKEFDRDMPAILPKLKNKVIFIYGDGDKNIEGTKDFIKKYITIKNSDHNVFVHQPEEVVKILKKYIS